MKKYNIIEFGAIADNKTINTRFIQRALDQCKRGDEVIIPRGIFLTGALFLHSGVRLILQNGAVLKGSNNIGDYPSFIYRFEGIEQECYSSLINVLDGEHSDIQICGQGVIDGSGDELYAKEMESDKFCRGRVISIRNTRNLSITGITICNSSAWTIHVIYCKNVRISNIHVYSKYNFNFTNENLDLTNGDGITFDSTTDAIVSKCVIDSQDDCISIKSGKNHEGRIIGKACRNIFVKDNMFLGGAGGVAIGSEMSGGIENIKIQNCVFINVLSILSVKANIKRGGYIFNIVVEDSNLVNYDLKNVNLTNYKAAIYVDECYKVEKEKDIANEIPIISELKLERININNRYGKLMYVRGIQSSPIRSITLNDVVSYSKGGVEVIGASVYFKNVVDNGILLKEI